MSIKYRDGSDYSGYRALIEGYLEGELNLKTKEARGDFQGRAWLVVDDHQHKVLLVEHETGLEILYVAGSIASLLSLVPLINSGWKFMQGRFLDPKFFRDRGMGIEIRMLDKKNQLIEQRVLRVEDYVLSECLKEIAALRARVEQLEREHKKTIKNDDKKSNNKKPVRQVRKNRK